MTKRTLLTMLTTGALVCAIASGETTVKSKGGTVSIEVRTGDARSVWLGVRIVPVPPALAAHLKTKGAGVMVDNLVKDGPAHKARLKRYDVIVAMDGEAVENGQALIEAVRSRKVGDKVALAVIRKGRKKTVSVVLDKLGSAEQTKLVYKEDARAMWQDVLRLHPGVILRKGMGTWERMDDKDLPDEIRKLLKKIPEMKIYRDTANAHISSKIVVRIKDDKGRDVQIEQDETGRITVRRKKVDEDGKETEDVSNFKDLDGLRLKDKEAYDLFKKSNIRNIFTTGKHRFRVEMPPMIRHFSGPVLVDPRKWQKDIREQLLKSLDKIDIPDDVREMIKKQIEKSIRAGRGDGDKDETGKDKPGTGKKSQKSKPGGKKIGDKTPV